jgi:RimJ/RimL family protein N-acetyltransferase
MQLEDDIIIEGEDLVLEELAAKHLTDLAIIAVANPDLLQYSPTFFGSEKAIEVMIEDAQADRKAGIRVAFAIYSKSLKKYIGSSSFGSIALKDQRLEIGWTWLSPEVQGSGLNNKCKFLMLRHAFENMGIKRVEFRTDARNIRSIKAIEKLGATKEGLLRSHMLMLDGQRRDTFYYSILTEEWPKLKTEVFGE